jgi:hypothetical protein
MAALPDEQECVAALDGCQIKILKAQKGTAALPSLFD